MTTLVDDSLRDLIRGAQAVAAADGARAIEAEHLLLTLAGPRPTVTAELLASVGLDHASVRAALDAERDHSLLAAGVSVRPGGLPAAGAPGRARVPFGASAKLALHRGHEAASAGHGRRMGPMHVLLGVLRAERGTVPRALALAGFDRVDLARRAARVIDGRPDD